MTCCPNCNYERKETDTNPDWECPSCGVAYVKTEQKKEDVLSVKTLKKTNDDTGPDHSNLKAQLLIVAFICLVIGYFAGREHLKYELKSSMEGVFSSIKNGVSSNNDKSFVEDRISDIKSTLKPNFVTPVISNKRFEKYNYEEHIWFDVTWDTSELKKPTRAIKGILIFSDIFGETKFLIKKTINEPLSPNIPLVESDVGFEFNQFKDDHKWMLSTELKDMTFKFDIKNIIYTDGTSESFE